MNFHFISGNLSLSNQNILDQVEKNQKELDEFIRSGLLVSIYFDCSILN